nr:MAG TPA: hypothetical protein [Caudoviricetes sp.]
MGDENGQMASRHGAVYGWEGDRALVPDRWGNIAVIRTVDLCG